MWWYYLPGLRSCNRTTPSRRRLRELDRLVVLVRGGLDGYRMQRLPDRQCVPNRVQRHLRLRKRAVWLFASQRGEWAERDDGVQHRLDRLCVEFDELRREREFPCFWLSSPSIHDYGQNPTLQAIYPLHSTLNILRTLNGTYSPMPNTTSFGVAGSIYAQLFYEGQEQFYCTADSCVQTLGDGTSSNTTDVATESNDWLCQNLKCHCFPGSEFCGAVPATNLTVTLDELTGSLEINCGAVSATDSTATCSFKQATILAVFGSAGLSLTGCKFGECVHQYVIDDFTGTASNSTDTNSGKPLDGGVIAGLAVVGALVGFALLVLFFGWLSQRRARRATFNRFSEKGGIGVQWSNINYIVPNTAAGFMDSLRAFFRPSDKYNGYKVVLDSVSGSVEPGQMMAILGPSGACFHSEKCVISDLSNLSGAGKTTLIEIIAGRSKIGRATGSVTFPGHPNRPLIGFVPQQDVLPPTLTVYEALLFAARLRLPECIPDSEKIARVDEIIEKLGLSHVRDVRIGDGEKRGISGGEMRRVSIGVELVAMPQVLILDEPTSGLDSVSAAKVATVLHELAHDPDERRVVIATIHQPR